MPPRSLWHNRLPRHGTPLPNIDGRGGPGDQTSSDTFCHLHRPGGPRDPPDTHIPTYVFYNTGRADLARWVFPTAVTSQENAGGLVTSLQGLGSDGTTPGVGAACWDGCRADDAGPSRGVRRPEHYLVISRISIFRLDRKASVGIKVDVVCRGATKGRARGARAPSPPLETYPTSDF